MSVTTDLKVLQAWPKSKKPVTAAAVAAALKLTVFQVTARLKGMEQRGFIERIDGQWHRTDVGMAEAKNPSPSLLAATLPKVPRAAMQAGKVATPSDTGVPHIPGALKADGWKSNYRGMTTIYTAPDGREYVRAKFFETADLIVDWPKDGWNYTACGTIRLRLLATSVIKKQEKRKARVEEENVARAAAKKEQRPAFVSRVGDGQRTSKSKKKLKAKRHK